MTTTLAILEIIISFVPYVLVSVAAYHALKNICGQQDKKSTEIEWENNTCKIYKDGKH